MLKLIDLTGQRFGKLIVLEKTLICSRLGNFTMGWTCLCDCGNKKSALSNNLKRGLTQSCGCLHKKTVTKHGLSHTTEYKIWNNIKQRCYSENHSDYGNYGAKGVTVSNEWLDSFETFYKDMGPRPSLQHSIDRRENNKGYYKENCRWATHTEQMNNRTNNIFYTLKGTSKTLSTWCRELNLDYFLIYQRLQAGWSFENAITLPKTK